MTTHTVLVTGAAGFIGSHLIDRLEREERYAVQALSREPHEDTQRVTFVRGDLASPETFRMALADSTAVVHLASVIDITQSLAAPRENIDRNVDMLLSLLEEIRKGGKKQLVIFTSTDRLYGRTTKRVVTETETPFPLEPYTAAKIMCETLLTTYQSLYGIPYIVLRMDSVYGPRQPRTMFISDIIQKMITESTVLVGNLAAKKNFVYVGDVVDALVAALDAPERMHNTAYNIGGPLVSMEDIAHIVQRLIETRLTKSITIRSSEALKRPSNIEVRPFRLSTAKARRCLGWKPRTTLADGLAATINYFVHEHETQG